MMYVPVFEGKVAFISYLASAVCLLAAAAQSYSVWVVLAEVTFLFLALLLPPFRHVTRVIAISYGLGLAFGAGLLLVLTSDALPHLGLYVMSLSFFHLSEYVLTATFNSRTLSLDSFLINHSVEYVVAAVASWVEFAVEYWLFPGLKQHCLVSTLGAMLVVAGELLRKVAMYQAGANFTHVVREQRHQGHRLVTTGLYAWVRHPSYVGWFYWSVGTQVLLCNPVCLVGYTLASWHFFSVRVYDEERYLINFFHQDYVDYKKRVSTGLPFIKGFPLELVRSTFPTCDFKVN